MISICGRQLSYLFVVALLALMVVGCKKESVVEVNFTPEDLEQAKLQAEERARKETDAKRITDETTNTEALANEKESSIKTVSGEFRPVVIEAINMTASNPSAVYMDEEKGLLIKSYCELTMDNVELPFVPKSITIEGKGVVANDIPPKFSLIMFNEKGNALTPWGGDGICSGTQYTRVYKDVWYLPENPILAGKYKIAFYYLNNNEGINPGDKADRNLYLKKIEFHP